MKITSRLPFRPVSPWFSSSLRVPAIILPPTAAIIGAFFCQEFLKEFFLYWTFWLPNLIQNLLSECLASSSLLLSPPGCPESRLSPKVTWILKSTGSISLNWTLILFLAFREAYPFQRVCFFLENCQKLIFMYDICMYTCDIKGRVGKERSDLIIWSRGSPRL